MTQTALVTGGSKGIGAATAKRLAEDGYRVVLLARGREAIDKTCSQIRSRHGEAIGITCDIADKKSVDEALDRIQEEVGTPGILVNNAGFGGPFHRIDQVSDDEWEAIFAVNVRGPFWFCRALLPKMKRQNFGRVINIGSVQSLRGAVHSSTYVSTKHALVGFTKSLACEWGPFGITCNIVCPGYVRTEMLPPNFEETSGLSSRIPAGRFASPDEIADAVSFLARAGSAYVNGAVITVDGGLIAGYDNPPKEAI
jgi:3-oxoacyl-[acyl-carrier protein] reductase